MQIIQRKPVEYHMELKNNIKQNMKREKKSCQQRVNWQNGNMVKCTPNNTMAYTINSQIKAGI